MQVRWVRTLARTLVVCACTSALATAGAHATDLRSQVKEEADRREFETGNCSNGQTLPGAVPLEVLKSCGTQPQVEPAGDFSKFTQLGPIVLQVPTTTTAGTYNTSSVPGITTLTPFAPFTFGSTDFPADVEILASDPVHIYELMASGGVKSYTTSGTASVISTVTPPVGETWTDMAVDPTTGTVYALSSNSACTAAKLFTVNLLAGTSTQVG